MTRLMTLGDLCQLAHPTNGNARQIRLCVRTEADLHDLATWGDGFPAEARAEWGEYLIREWIARGKPGEAAQIARDPVYRDVISMDVLVMSGAEDEIAARRRLLYAAGQPMDVGAQASEFDEIDHMAAWSEMPMGGAH